MMTCMEISLCEKGPHSEFFWSLFSRIRTESLRFSPNARKLENPECGHFSRVCVSEMGLLDGKVSIYNLMFFY